MALQAASFASAQNLPLVYTSSSTSPTAAEVTLDALSATDVWLFGADASFTSGFIADLGTGRTIVGQIIDDSPLVRADEAIGAGSPDAINIVLAGQPFDLSLAAAESARTGRPLVPLAGTESPAAIAMLLTQFPDAKILVIGAGATLPAGAVDPGQEANIDTLDTADQALATLRVAQRAVFEGALGNDVVAAPSDQPASAALAGLLARKSGGVTMLAGAAATIADSSPASEYLSLWASETAAVTLVGTTLDSSDLTSLTAPTLALRADPPSFRVTNLTSSGGSYTVTATAVPGATTYSAFDGEGALAATSAVPTLTVSGTPGVLAIYADGPSGELGHLEIRSNDYLASTGRDDAIVASVSGESAHLAFLGSDDTPRVITRSMTDPFSEEPAAGPTEIIAITCDSTFTDSGIDPTKQWAYTVAVLSSADQLTCDSSANPGPSPETDLLVAGVTLPPTEFPFAEKSANGAGEAARGPAHTIAEAAILAAAQAGESASRGPGDDWSDVLFRYQAYIPEQYVGMPEPSGDSSRPVIAFGGDNHGPNTPWGGQRFKIDTTVRFGSDHGVSSSVTMGTTYKYKCALDSNLKLVNCVEIAHQTQVNTQVGQATSPHTATTADVNVWSQTYNPLSPLAPAIDMTMKYKLRTSGSALIGAHDLMPLHEIYFGLPFSEWVSIYRSGVHLLPCLYAVDFPVLDAGCRARLNVQF